MATTCGMARHGTHAWWVAQCRVCEQGGVKRGEDVCIHTQDGGTSLGREGRDWGCGNAAEASRRQTSEYSAMNKPRPPRHASAVPSSSNPLSHPPSPFNLEPSWQATHEREQVCARVRRPRRAVNRRMLAQRCEQQIQTQCRDSEGHAATHPQPLCVLGGRGGECARANACVCGEREKECERQVNSKIYAYTPG
jgi:hypothetical protein